MRDFITCLLSILKKIVPPLPLAHQLDRNLRPDLQRMGRRVDFDDIDSLLELSVEAELTIEAEKSYREPPPPEQSLVPEAAYQPRRTKEKQTPLKVSAFPVSNPSLAEGEGQSWIASLSKMLAQEVKLALQPTLNNAQSVQPLQTSCSPKKKKKGAGGEKSERAGDSPKRNSRPRHQEGKNHRIAAQRHRRVTMKEFIVTAAACRAIAPIIALRVRETGKRARRQGRRVARNRGDPARSRRRGLYYSDRAARRASSDSAGERA